MGESTGQSRKGNRERNTPVELPSLGWVGRPEVCGDCHMCVHGCVRTAMALCEDLELVHPLVHGTAEGTGGFYVSLVFIF